MWTTNAYINVGEVYSKETTMAKMKHPIEVFGHPIDVDLPEAREDRERYWCPFVDGECDKRSRLIDYPMGVCSVQYGDEIIALSPRRFMQDNIIFYDIADRYFGTRNDLLVFPEVSIPGARNLGVFDFVMVKHKPLSSEIEDFVTIELQTGQTTGTGSLVEALEDFMAGREVAGKSYRFGLNLADIWKRAFIQILTKGIVMERWGHKIYWVVQEPIYQDFLDRYNLHNMTYAADENTVFAIYDLRRSGDEYQLYQTRIESSTIDDLFDAFRTNLEVPPKQVFVGKLEQKVEKQVEAKIGLALEA
jgi:hypothetical protein